MEKKIVLTKGIKDNPCSIDIRQTVFVMEQGFVDEFDEIDDVAWHAVLFLDGVAVATARTYETENGWHIGRVAVLESYRKMGLGEVIMTAVEEKARELGAKEISLSAQMQAKDFYKKIGYASLEDLHYDQHCPHVTMVKKL